MSKLLYRYKVDDKNYVFDGEDICIYEDTGAKKQSQLQPIAIDMHKSSFFNTIMFVINNRCNMDCYYCYAKESNNEKQEKILDLDTAKKSVDLLIQSLRKNNSEKLSIGFIGGEPLLEFKLIKQIVEYTNLNSDGLKTNFSVLTNGTLLNDEVVDFLSEHNFRVIISIDGTKEMHDRCRVYNDGTGTYDLIVNNINRYKEKINITTRSTITDDNYDIYKIVTHMISLGIKDISFGYDCYIKEETKIKFMDSYKKTIGKLYEDIMEGRFYKINNINIYLYYLVGRFRNCSNCNAGVAYKAIGADGGIYLCHRFAGNNDLLMGNVHNCDLEALNNDFIMKRKTDVGERVASCKMCAFKYLCGGICYHHAYSMAGDIFKKTQLACLIKQMYMKSTLELIVKLPVEKRREYLLFLSGDLT